MLFLLGLLATLSYVPGWTGSYIPTMWATLSIALALTLWAPSPQTRYHWLGLAFLAYAFASLLWTPVVYLGVWQLWQLTVLALAFRLGSASASLVPLYKGLAIGLGLNSALAVAQWAGWDPVQVATGQTPGLLFNPIALGEGSAILIVALASEGLWFWIPALIPGLLLSHSRGGLLMLGIMFIIAMTRRVWPAALLMVGCAALLIWHPSESDAYRLLVWHIAIERFDLFGNGVGSFMTVLLARAPNWLHLEYVHNDYLDYTYQYGIGAVLLFGLVAALGLRARYSPPWYPFIGVLVMALYSFPTQAPVTALLFALCAGHLIRCPARVWSWSDGWGFGELPWRSSFGGEALPVQLGTSLRIPNPRAQSSALQMVGE